MGFLQSDQQPLVVGHRGAAGLEPENTLRSFRHALELGVDLVECDVHVSRDGHLVVLHDDHVDRTTNGSGAVNEMTLPDLKQLDAGYGETLPTLQEVLDVVRDRVPLFIELKGEGTAEPAVDLVMKEAMADQVVFISFEGSRLLTVKHLQSSLKTMLLYYEIPRRACFWAGDLGCEGLGVYHGNLTRELVVEAHLRGLTINVWTPNTENEIQDVLSKRVDSISSDRPDLVLKLLG